MKEEVTPKATRGKYWYKIDDECDTIFHVLKGKTRLGYFYYVKKWKEWVFEPVAGMSFRPLTIAMLNAALVSDNSFLNKKGITK